MNDNRKRCFGKIDPNPFLCDGCTDKRDCTIERIKYYKKLTSNAKDGER